MSEKRRDGGPAWPTLRDWFAGMAMQGMQGTVRTWQEGEKTGPGGDPKRYTEYDLAGESYRVADAMLAVREKGDG